MGMSDAEMSGGVTVRLPDGTLTGSFRIAFNNLRPSGHVQWERFDPATETEEEWECHFFSCLIGGATGTQYLPQYNEPPVLLHSSRAWDVL